MEDTHLEFWLKRIALIISTLSGVIAFVPQLSGVFGPFDYGAEVMLLLFAAGIILYGIVLLRTNASADTNGKSSPANKRTTGIILIVGAPVITFLLWVTFLRIPADVENQINLELARGDTDLFLERLDEALNHYKNAFLLAPRRGSIRAKIQDVEERLKAK